MKTMKSLLLLICVSFIATGCTKLKFGEHIASIENFTPASADFMVSESSIKLDDNFVDAVYEVGLLNDKKVKGPRLKSDRSLQSGLSKFPEWIKKSPTAIKILKQESKNISKASASFTEEERTALGQYGAQKFTAKELSNFSLLLLKKSGLFRDKKSEEMNNLILNLNDNSKEKSIYDYRLIYYLAAYFEGKYVDRSGVKYEKPKFSSAVGNDTIIPLIMVVLDAFYDTYSNVPVFYRNFEKNKFSNPVVGKNEPTVALFETSLLEISSGVLKGSEIKKVVMDYCTVNDEGCKWNEEYNYKYITLNEAKTINLISEIGAEQSKHISGLVVRTFNDVEFGAIAIGGDISVGDNDTFSKIVEASVAQLARATTEHQLYDYLRQEEGDDSNLHEFVSIIGNIYESLNKDEKKQ